MTFLVHLLSIWPQVGPKLVQVGPKLTPSWPQVGPWDQSWSHLGPILEPSWPPGTPQGSPGTPRDPQGTIFHQFLIKVGLIFDQNSIIFEVRCIPTFALQSSSTPSLLGPRRDGRSVHNFQKFWGGYVPHPPTPKNR